MTDDARTAYLFQCGTEELFAVSRNKVGEALPRSSCTQGWLLRQEFQLGPREPVPALVEQSPSSAASTPRATTSGATLAGGKEEHLGCQRPSPFLQFRKLRAPSDKAAAAIAFVLVGGFILLGHRRSLRPPA